MDGQKTPHLENIDELDRYLHEPILSALDSVIYWWKDPAQIAKFTLLAAMSLDIFSIPAMSSEPERVFSGAKNTISPEGAIERQLTFLGVNYRSLFVTEVYHPGRPMVYRGLY